LGHGVVNSDRLPSELLSDLPDSGLKDPGNFKFCQSIDTKTSDLTNTNIKMTNPTYYLCPVPCCTQYENKDQKTADVTPSSTKTTVVYK